MSKIDRLTIKGFKSIRHLDNFEMRNLNILIGANGTGKSNFISYFRMLGEAVEQRLQYWTREKEGSADRIVSFGIQETTLLESFISFGDNGYEFKLSPTIDGKFVFFSERVLYVGTSKRENWRSLGTGHTEAKIKDVAKENIEIEEAKIIAKYCYPAISEWKLFHFHDTSDTAKVKRLCSLHDSKYLKPDAANLAAFLYRL